VLADRNALGEWTERFEQECTELVHRLLAASSTVRRDLWRELMTRLGPHLEQWAEQSYVLRRCRLATPDDARAVLVHALERLQANDFANLRKFAGRHDPGEASDRADTATLTCVVKLAAEDDQAGDSEPAVDPRTPLRAWLLTLLRYTVKDHVRDRLGWGHAARSGEHAAGSKRDVNSQATRLDDHDEHGERPPVTDFLTLQKFLVDVIAFVETFPADMQRATRLWLDDRSVDEIATDLAVSAAQATALVRSAKARLRERFRGDWDQLQGLGG
jgi:DNA-directed RNA polymerase specialized sigma24 family protein